MQLYYHVITRDRYGRVLSEEEALSRCWLVAYLRLIFGQAAQVIQTVKDITGTNRASDTNGACLRMHEAVAGFANAGIVVGSGVVAVALDDYKLDSQILHGVAVGQISYGAQSITSPTVDATSSYFTVTRSFPYLFGSGSIIVREIGMYGQIESVLPSHACLARDTLGVPQIVPDGGSMTVIYTVKAVE